MSKVVEVQIAGKIFSFKLPNDIKPEKFYEIISHVEDTMNKIKRDNIDLDFFKMALLTSINLAEESFSLKKENESLKVMLNKIDEIVTPLEEESKSLIKFSS